MGRKKQTVKKALPRFLKNPAGEKGHTIKALKKENKILRAEVKRLSRIIKAKTIDETHSLNPKNNKAKLWTSFEKESHLLSSGSYMKYLVSKITGGSLFAFSKKAMGYFRKFKLISTIMRVMSSAFAILGTGAFFIFFSGALVFIIPIIVAFCATIYFMGTISRAKAFRQIEKESKHKSIYVFAPTKERPFERTSYFRHSLKRIAEEENDSFIIVISPYLFSALGFGGDGVKFYPVARFEGKNICIVRRHSFFLLRKRILEPAAKRTVYIY